MDELLNEAKNSEEKAKKAMVDAARLADELRAEQDHAQTQEKLRKALETQIKELQVRKNLKLLFTNLNRENIIFLFVDKRYKIY